MHTAYNTYYASSVYDERYPAPNRRTLRYLLDRLPGPSCDIVDLGAGNGRYALPLLVATGHRVYAVERSPEARAQLAERGQYWLSQGRLQIAGELDEVPLEDLDLGAVLFLFGVLAHMCHKEREAVLSRLRDVAINLFPLIGSVPNCRRRFSVEQRSAVADGPLELPRIRYHRILDSKSAEFSYTLFTPSSLRAELDSLGWSLDHVTAESLFPESGITRSATLGTLDQLVASAIPAVTGYGLLFSAYPK